jgi:hypothetical protein
MDGELQAFPKPRKTALMTSIQVMDTYFKPMSTDVKKPTEVGFYGAFAGVNPTF